ncbi:hypothetical protein EOPP23_18085 [Endozoicomonas sp. OPT23]|uniref:hypothetical protein n=1 Tax=Endozoicomonas sp. OPT23 TaxID=2072845 RepID=UPI00129A52B5|nr:hypothetical protein [Endozoicomonas sp. OPT23]MRI34891.1 hypothetical protein [Endozoicomonas sp. OPT23]
MYWYRAAIVILFSAAMISGVVQVCVGGDPPEDSSKKFKLEKKSFEGSSVTVDYYYEENNELKVRLIYTPETKEVNVIYTSTIRHFFDGMDHQLKKSENVNIEMNSVEELSEADGGSLFSNRIFTTNYFPVPLQPDSINEIIGPLTATKTLQEHTVIIEPLPDISLVVLQKILDLSESDAHFPFDSTIRYALTISEFTAPSSEMSELPGFEVIRLKAGDSPSIVLQNEQLTKTSLIWLRGAGSEESQPAVMPLTASGELLHSRGVEYTEASLSPEQIQKLFQTGINSGQLSLDAASVVSDTESSGVFSEPVQTSVSLEEQTKKVEQKMLDTIKILEEIDKSKREFWPFYFKNLVPWLKKVSSDHESPIGTYSTISILHAEREIKEIFGVVAEYQSGVSRLKKLYEEHVLVLNKKQEHQNKGTTSRVNTDQRVDLTTHQKVSRAAKALLDKTQQDDTTGPLGYWVGMTAYEKADSSVSSPAKGSSATTAKLRSGLDEIFKHSRLNEDDKLRKAMTDFFSTFSVEIAVNHEIEELNRLMNSEVFDGHEEDVITHALSGLRQIREEQPLIPPAVPIQSGTSESVTQEIITDSEQIPSAEDVKGESQVEGGQQDTTLRLVLSPVLQNAIEAHQRRRLNVALRPEVPLPVIEYDELVASISATSTDKPTGSTPPDRHLDDSHLGDSYQNADSRPSGSVDESRVSSKNRALQVEDKAVASLTSPTPIDSAEGESGYTPQSDPLVQELYPDMNLDWESFFRLVHAWNALLKTESTEGAQQAFAIGLGQRRAIMVGSESQSASFAPVRFQELLKVPQGPEYTTGLADIHGTQETGSDALAENNNPSGYDALRFEYSNKERLSLALTTLSNLNTFLMESIACAVWNDWIYYGGVASVAHTGKKISDIANVFPVEQRDKIQTVVSQTLEYLFSPGVQSGIAAASPALFSAKQYLGAQYLFGAPYIRYLMHPSHIARLGNHLVFTLDDLAYEGADIKKLVRIFRYWLDYVGPIQQRISDRMDRRFRQYKTRDINMTESEFEDLQMRDRLFLDQLDESNSDWEAAVEPAVHSMWKEYNKKQQAIWIENARWAYNYRKLEQLVRDNVDYTTGYISLTRPATTLMAHSVRAKFMKMLFATFRSAMSTAPVVNPEQRSEVPVNRRHLVKNFLHDGVTLMLFHGLYDWTYSDLRWSTTLVRPLLEESERFVRESFGFEFEPAITQAFLSKAPMLSLSHKESLLRGLGELMMDDPTEALDKLNPMVSSMISFILLTPPWLFNIYDIASGVHQSPTHTVTVGRSPLIIDPDYVDINLTATERFNAQHTLGYQSELDNLNLLSNVSFVEMLDVFLMSWRFILQEREQSNCQILGKQPYP